MGVNNTQNKNRELFETMPVAAAVRTMAVPTVIGQLTHKRYLKKSGLTEKIKNQSFLSA